MELTFLKKLIRRLSQDVFKPLIGNVATIPGGFVNNGLLYIVLQTISREISGECSWDSGTECQKSFSNYYQGPKCRNIICPGYLHPLGLISYTSRSSALSSVDNRFDYNSFRWLTTDDFVPVGTLGAEIKFDFGVGADLGGYGAGFYGAGLYGGNAIPLGAYHAVIGDKWRIDCVATTGVVGPAVPISVAGTYGPIVTRGTYLGDFDTYYIVEIIDYWGWVQNFQDAVLQISLATATSEWVDYWGEYFGIPRLLLTGGYEDDSTYKARIMKEITRAKGTKPVLEEEARAYFGRSDINIIEYHQTYGVAPSTWASGFGYSNSNVVKPTVATGFEYICLTGGVSGATEPVWSTSIGGLTIDGPVVWVCKLPKGVDLPVPLAPPDINWPPDLVRTYNEPFPWPNPDPAWGLQPYQFYIFPPMQKVPSAKWIKTKDTLIEPDQWTGAPLSSGSGMPKVYAQESSYYSGGYGYGSGSFTPSPLANVSNIDEFRNWLFITPAQVGDAVLFGCTKRFSGLRMIFSLPITYDDSHHPNPIPPGTPDGYLYDELPTPEVYNQLDGSGSGTGGTYLWEYWNGIGWTLLTVTDGTVIGGPSTGSTIVNGFEQDGWINWKLPGAATGVYSLWVKANNVPLNIPNVVDGLERYWIRCRIGVAPTVTPDCNYIGFVYAGSTNRGCYNGTGVKGVLPITPVDIVASQIYVADKQPGADPPLTYMVVTLYKGDAVAVVAPYGKRDVNNSYVYSGDAWAKPEWESGLQDIIDRLKTAGTICIVNPPT